MHDDGDERSKLISLTLSSKTLDSIQALFHKIYFLPFLLPLPSVFLISPLLKAEIPSLGHPSLWTNSNKHLHIPGGAHQPTVLNLLSFQYPHMLPTPRSTSLPAVAPPLSANGVNVYHQIARKDSRSVVPMTPPMSPTEAETRMDDMALDHPVPHSKDSDVDHLSIQDSEIDPEPLPIHPSIRTLDESRDCLPRSLRLTDFEVRGTLGTFLPHRVALHSWRLPIVCAHSIATHRCRHVWARVTRSTPQSFQPNKIRQLLRPQGPPQVGDRPTQTSGAC